MKKNRKLAVVMVASIVAVIVILSVIVAMTGYQQFTHVLEQQYNDTAYEVAETALTYLDPDKLEGYLQSGQTDEEYDAILARLDELVLSSNCNFIYVAKIDETDYMTTTYIYDSVNPATGFSRYEFGYVSRDTDPKYVDDLKHILTTGGRAEKYLYSYTESGAHTTAGLAVQDSTGKVVAVIGVEKSMTVLYGARSTYVRWVVSIAAAMVILSLLVYLLWLNGRVIRPIAEITGEAQRFAIDGENPATSLKATENRYEIGVLASSILKMEAEIKQYIDNLTAVTAEKERIGAELDIATHIQSSMLPCIFPAFPDRPEVDIYASMNPAKEVGGDFYDFFMVDDTHLAIVMADVSGKGVPAALFMVIGKTLIKDHTTPGRDLGEVFMEVNKLLCEGNGEELFITAFEGVLDLETGQFNFVNAGHEMPFIRRKGKFAPEKIRAGFVLAGMDMTRYRMGSLQMEPGDAIFQYTDGVTEATNGNNELYGMERLEAVLNKNADAAPDALLPAVKADIDAFVGDAPQFDDITMLCLEFKKMMNASDPNEMTVEATLENIPAVTAFVDERLEALDCPMKAQMQIDVAIDELFSNIARYAYDPSGPATVRVDVDQEPLSVRVTFIDHGKPYDPLAKEDPDVTLSAEDRQIGGLGIFMVKKSMDDVRYEYKDGQNILTVEKRLEP